MFDHPTLDLLHELGLHTAWRAVFASSPKIPRRAVSNTANGSPSCSSTRPPCGARSVSRHAPEPPGCDMPPASRISITTPQRGLDRALFLKLAACNWIRQHRNLLVTGPTGLVA
jgi:hypothetical protein